MATDLDQLLEDVRSCRICEASLPHGCRPVIRASKSARILVVGQAPGRRVHESGVPFDDPSGDRLRQWMGIDKPTFYNEQKINIIPMGFCYPGTGKSGDLPPRSECAEAWRDRLMTEMGQIALTLVIGQYAIGWHLKGQSKKTLTETVKAWKEYWPAAVVLPHPSPRNNIWLKRNPWFEDEVLPPLRQKIQELL
ncbi:MAG: uracil-DNA glycosylase family protein [Sneathiella sp.]|nr:uracil-DNA glycosylase family protein [Sneathiella sp.]